jgi:hypothetical protein
MRNKNLAIDGHLARELSGDKKIRALMDAKAGSVSRWAVNQGYIPEQVFMALSGKRPYPEIRELIAADLELTREEVDRLIDSSAVAAA